jgi:putative oxidoreductase
MSIALWILQVLLAAQFLWHGWLMVAPPAELIPIMDAQFAPWFRIFVGVAESLGAIGLILPGITRILPWLTPLAAVGLMIVAGSATGLHLSRVKRAVRSSRQYCLSFSRLWPTCAGR